jgi:hypothetical protein
MTYTQKTAAGISYSSNYEPLVSALKNGVLWGIRADVTGLYEIDTNPSTPTVQTHFINNIPSKVSGLNGNQRIFGTPGSDGQKIYLSYQSASTPTYSLVEIDIDTQTGRTLRTSGSGLAMHNLTTDGKCFISEGTSLRLFDLQTLTSLASVSGVDLSGNKLGYAAHRYAGRFIPVGIGTSYAYDMEENRWVTAAQPLYGAFADITAAAVSFYLRMFPISITSQNIATPIETSFFNAGYFIASSGSESFGASAFDHNRPIYGFPMVTPA